MIDMGHIKPVYLLGGAAAVVVLMVAMKGGGGGSNSTLAQVNADQLGASTSLGALSIQANAAQAIQAHTDDTSITLAALSTQGHMADVAAAAAAQSAVVNGGVMTSALTTAAKKAVDLATISLNGQIAGQQTDLSKYAIGTAASRDIELAHIGAKASTDLASLSNIATNILATAGLEATRVTTGAALDATKYTTDAGITGLKYQTDANQQIANAEIWTQQQAGQWNFELGLSQIPLVAQQLDNQRYAIRKGAASADLQTIVGGVSGVVKGLFAMFGM